MSTRLFRLAAVVGIVLLPALSGGFGTGPVDLSRYMRPQDGFSISLPVDWARREGFAGAALVAFAPDETVPGFRENVQINLETVHPQRSTDEFIRASLSVMKAHYRDFRAHDSGSGLTEFSEPLRWVTISYRVANFQLSGVVYYLRSEERVCSLGFVTARHRFPVVRESFHRIALSARFEQVEIRRL
jgi:hypothetical protein